MCEAIMCGMCKEYRKKYLHLIGQFSWRARDSSEEAARAEAYDISCRVSLPRPIQEDW